jgi:hypothetical protein
VPATPEERRAWLGWQRSDRLRRAAALYRDKLIALYGEERGRGVQHAEAFEACEYGTPLSDENRGRLFPFFD